MHRSVNFIRILSGYLLSRLARKVYHWGNPVSVSIEPTNRCNLHCPECPSGQLQLTRSKGNISYERYVRIIDPLAKDLFYLNLYFQGEPYMHPDFFRLVKYAAGKGIFVSTSTNGHFLTPENVRQTLESGLNKLIISLDGTNQPSYEAYRKGGSFDRVAEGIRELVRQKKEQSALIPKVVIQFIVFKTNQDQIAEVKRLGREWGVDKVEIKTAQFYNFDKGNPLMPDNEKFSRYRKIKGDDGMTRFETRNNMPDHCWRIWSSCVFTWEGDVVPCCYDKDGTLSMGNIDTKSFQEIWRNRSYTSFRQQILTERKEVGICRNCDQKY
ncbi:MAG TPA: radical SAM protein [Bacteroidales bacterium]|nr:radical SAM protein [Bacteroidales bacterium]